MYKLLILLTFLLSTNVYPVDLNKHPIYAQIIKNKPSIDKKYAMKLSNIIYKMHRKYHIPSRIFAAILMQESGYTLKINGCHKGLMRKMTEEEARNKCHTFNVEKFSKCFVDNTKYVEVKICSDFGISQIYFKTAERFGINIYKLTTDLEYSVEAGAKVLANFMEKYEARDNDWWTRYNCGTRGSTDRDTCQVYKQLVERYL